MKITDLWKAHEKPTVSFELFPAKTEKGAANLEKAIDALAGLGPDFVSVTFGAGGSTREGSHQLVKKLKQEKGLEVIAYFAGYGLGGDAIVEVLDAYREIGVENILIVRGDPPQDKDFQPHPDSFAHATDLLAFVRPRYPELCIGVASYPESHIEAESKEKDLGYLKQKVDLGAEYIMSNYFYDNRFYFDFVERCRAIGIEAPIVPGVMPIYSVKMMEMLAGLCGATITDAIRQGIASLPPDDKEALLAWGIEFATKQCSELIEAGVPGLHIYTMDRAQSATGIIGRLRDKEVL